MGTRTERSRGISAAPKLLVVAALLLAGCAFEQPATYEIPTERESVAFLADAVEFVRAGDFAGLCDMTGGPDGNCPVLLQNGVEEAAPDTAPVVFRSYVVDSVVVGDAVEVGGRALVVCGTDANGLFYSTEMLTLKVNGVVTALHPLYWSGVDYSGSNSTVREPGEADCQ